MVVMADQLTLSAYTNNAVDKLDSRVTAAEVFDKVKAQKRIALKKDTLKTLKAKATQLGFTSGTLHNIDEEDDPKEALIERLLAKMGESQDPSSTVHPFRRLVDPSTQAMRRWLVIL